MQCALSMYIRRSLIFSAVADATCINLPTSFICLRVSCHHATYPRLPPTNPSFCSGQNPHCTGTSDRQNEIGGPHTHVLYARDQVALSLYLPTSHTIVGYLVRRPTNFLPPPCRPLHHSVGRKWPANMVSPSIMERSQTRSNTYHLPPKNSVANVCFPMFSNETLTFDVRGPWTCPRILCSPHFSTFCKIACVPRRWWDLENLKL